LPPGAFAFLLWTVLDKAGTSNQGERIALLRRYLALFGSGSIAWLLADREFIGSRWIEFLLENTILFAIRVKENSKIRLDDGRRYQLNTLLRKPAGFKLLQSRPARLEAMDESLGTPLRFAAKRLGDGELLIVASNGPAKKAPQKGGCATHQVATCSERRGSLVTRKSGGRDGRSRAKAARAVRNESEEAALTGGVSAATWCEG
jgi:hypothetical protein